MCIGIRRIGFSVPEGLITPTRDPRLTAAHIERTPAGTHHSTPCEPVAMPTPLQKCVPNGSERKVPSIQHATGLS